MVVAVSENREFVVPPRTEALLLAGERIASLLATPRGVLQTTLGTEVTMFRTRMLRTR